MEDVLFGMMTILLYVAEKSNDSDNQSVLQLHGFNGCPIVVGSSEGEEWEVVFVECGGVTEFGDICLFVC